MFRGRGGGRGGRGGGGFRGGRASHSSRGGGPSRRGHFRPSPEEEGASGDGAAGSSSRPVRPPHLRGREIGMFYAKLARERRKEEGNHEPNERYLRKLRKVELKHDVEFEINTLLERMKPVENNSIDWSSQESNYTTQNLYDGAGTSDDRRGKDSGGLVRDSNVDETLRDEFRKLGDKNIGYKNMMKFRSKLPAYSCRQEIVDLVSKNQVVVISGETGCGKTTQVPQFILDEMLSQSSGSICNILCTQPRRISAISVAERVAEERGERVGNNSVGYVIRLENKAPSRSQATITFCTTGVVFQYLKSDPYLKKYSHIILDEVHERDCSSDILISILRNLMTLRRDLKIILMSATINADQFSRYFNGCPMYNIPGLTFPVQEYYLEDIIEKLRYQFPTEIIKNGMRMPVNSRWESPEYEYFIMNMYTRRLQARKMYSHATIREISRPESEDSSCLMQLAQNLLEEICREDQNNGAVLIFVTGWGEISDLHNKLIDSGRFPESRFLILPLHSMMPTVNQREIFERPRNGMRKIVISTNLAETSITIDDIVFVIDCGKIKITNFDQKNNIESLDSEWVSRANAKQRKGRAGRVQEGVCYHLFSKGREEKMEDFKKPEILRKRLEDVILQLKILKIGDVRQFLAKMLDSPSKKAVDLSFERLQRLHALNDAEELTPLGFHLAHLPLDPQIGKMILMGSIFSCIDPIFTLAASLSFKDPFYIPLGKTEIVDKIRMDFANGTKSDHWATIKAIEGFESAVRNRNERNYCFRNFLSVSTCNMIVNFKSQFCEHLYGMKFLPNTDCKNQRSNLNSNNIALVNSIICSGLYPNVARVRKAGRRFVRLRTAEDGPVQIHPKSVNAKESVFESEFLVYHMKQKIKQIMLFDTTMVSPFALIFFGGKLEFFVRSNIPVLEVDSNVRFIVVKETFETIQGLRAQLDNILKYKIENPTPSDWTRASEEIEVLRAITNLLMAEYSQMMYHESDGDDDEDF